jgi:aspartyl-tRNA(Asn)/glutamyl-tRNA(Gln) amidotransferase subunit B
MEKGQMRAEPNISIRREGSDELGVKTELKNINSFRALHRAILYEVDRQQKLLESGGTVVQETRGWSEAEQRTFSQRSKEFAEDYRYFPEPDIPPIELDRAWIEDIRSALPEMPSVRRERLVGAHGLPASDVAVIGADRELADLFEAAVATGAPAKQVANWIVGEVAPTGKLPSPANLGELVKLVAGGAITRDQGREVLAESVETGRTPAEIAAEHGFKQVSDESELRVLAQAVIDANPKAAADYRGGKKQAMQALMQDLRKRAPHSNPRLASEQLLKLLG